MRWGLVNDMKLGWEIYLNVIICTKCSSEVELPMQTLHQTSVRSNVLQHTGKWRAVDDAMFLKGQIDCCSTIISYLNPQHAGGNVVQKCTQYTHGTVPQKTSGNEGDKWFNHTGRVWCALPGYSPREHPAPGKKSNILKLFIRTYSFRGNMSEPQRFSPTTRWERTKISTKKFEKRARKVISAKYFTNEPDTFVKIFLKTGKSRTENILCEKYLTKTVL